MIRDGITRVPALKGDHISNRLLRAAFAGGVELSGYRRSGDERSCPGVRLTALPTTPSCVPLLTQLQEEYHPGAGIFVPRQAHSGSSKRSLAEHLLSDEEKGEWSRTGSGSQEAGNAEDHG